MELWRKPAAGEIGETKTQKKNTSYRQSFVSAHLHTARDFVSATFRIVPVDTDRGAHALMRSSANDQHHSAMIRWSRCHVGADT